MSNIERLRDITIECTVLRNRISLECYSTLERDVLALLKEMQYVVVHRYVAGNIIQIRAI